MEPKKCPFCNVDSEKNRIIWEGWGIIAMLSNPRLMPGHTLVIPKKHVGALFELSWMRQIIVFWMVFRLQKKIIKVFSEVWGKPAGCDVAWHTRPFMPQTELSIPGHAHVHLRPRFWEDPYYQEVLKHETAVFQPLDPEEKEKYQALLKE